MRNRKPFAALALAGAVLVVPACESDSPNQGTPTEDVAVDTAKSPDGAEADATEPDATEPDATEPPDAGPDVPVTPPKLDAPEAWVFAHDPSIDGSELTKVTLRPPVSDDGSLKGEFVDVSNCLNEDGGETIMGGLARLCREAKTVFPDPDGHYLSVEPPANFGDTGDPFAEVMMYHYVNTIHDYFSGTHGLSYLDFPLSALVNVQFWVSADMAPFFGGSEGWQPFPNAAFMPEEGIQQLGLSPRAGGAIVFGQYALVDFAYDASVILHEYTHAMIGTGRLFGTLADAFGMDNLPGALNEGLADYFAASLLDHPVVGAFGIGGLDPNMVRDLSEKRVCPDDLTTEIHADGEIVGSAMWAIRAALGADTADGIILRAVQAMTLQTSFEGAAQLIVAEAELIGEDTATQVEAILTEYGLIGCERAKPWQAFSAGFGGLPYMVTTRTAAPVPGMTEWAPGYVQFYVDVPAGTAGVALTWEASAQQGPFGGGGGEVNMDLALRRGEPVEVTYGAKVGLKSDAIVPGAKAPSPSKGFAVTLTEGCLPAEGGRVYLTFLNKGNAETGIQKMGLALLDDAAGAANVATCAP